jgi:uncharacterized protein (DUF58 family)
VTLKNRRPFHVTRPGWIFILYTIGVGAGAINTGNNLLYLIFGVFLGLIIASGILSDSNLWNVALDWTFPTVTYVGEPTSYFVTAFNAKKWLPTLSLTIELHGSLRGENISLASFIPSVGKAAKTVQTTQFTPQRRGYLQIEQAALKTRFPFGLLEKKWTLHENSGTSGLFIYPKKWPVALEEILRQTLGHESDTASSAKGEGLTASGVRDFRPGDNPRRIHWKASARRSSGVVVPTWLLRETDLEKRPDITLVWPGVAEWTALQNESEDLISLTASAIDFFTALGNNVRLLIPEDAQTAWIVEKSPLEFLALVEFNPAALSQLAHYLQREEGTASEQENHVVMMEALKHARRA